MCQQLHCEMAGETERTRDQRIAECLSRISITGGSGGSAERDYSFCHGPYTVPHDVSPPTCSPLDITHSTILQGIFH